MLAEGLDDRFTIAPNLQVVHPHGQVDDVDVLVVGPYGVVVIEVKNLAGRVIVGEREMFVDGHQRGNPYVQTYAKARRIKSRIADHPQTRGTWVAPLVVLAQEPQELRVPENQRDVYVLVNDAVDVLLDDERWERGRNLEAFERQAVLRQLQLVSRKRQQRRQLGQFKLGRLVSETNVERRYEAVHDVLGTEHELVHIGYDSALLGSDGGRGAVESAFREAMALKEVGAHPNVRAATDLVRRDDGSVVLILPAPHGRSLRELLDDDEALSAEFAASVLTDIVAAVDHIHGGGVAHRRICPSLIEVDADGSAVLSGFGFAQIPEQIGNTRHISLALKPEETVFVAPELFLKGTAGTDADLFSIGMLAEELEVDSLGDIDLSGLRVNDPDERTPSIEEIVAALDPDDADDSVEVAGYQALKTLAEKPGAMTRLGYNVVTGQEVVLRTLSGPSAIDDARRIFESMQACAGPGIERVNTALPGPEGQVTVVSTFVDGRSLAEAIDTENLPDDRIGLLAMIAESIASVHRNGWIHGDVTAANVILGTPTPVLIDFGLAVPVGVMPAGGTPAYRPRPGTPRAEAPEGLDLFGLGVIAHEIFAGTRPATTDEGLEIASDQPWVPAVAAALGIGEHPVDVCPDVSSFIDLLKPATAPPELGEGVVGQADDGDETIGSGGGEDDVDVTGRRSDDGLYRRVDELIIAGRLDEADQLCPLDWVNLRERIVRARRQISKQLSEGGDEWARIGDAVVVAGPVTRTVVPLTIGNERDVRARVSQFTATLDDVGAELSVFEAANGEVWIACDDVIGSDELYGAIVNRLRIGAHDAANGRSRIDLALARYTTDRWSARKATSTEIEDAAGLTPEEALHPVDGVETGSRRDLLDDASPRRGYLCAVFEKPSVIDVLVRSYVLLRILPVIRNSPDRAAEPTKTTSEEALEPYPPDLASTRVVDFDSPTEAISDRLSEIVEHEGPMNVKRLHRSFRVAAGAGRVTGTRRAQLVACLEAIASEGSVELEGRASDDESIAKAPAQPWVRTRERGNRSIDEIPLNELAEVIDEVERRLPGSSTASIDDYVLRELYGRERVHSSTARRLDRAREVAGATASNGEGSKYSHLHQALAAISGRRAAMDFDEIARLVGGLPPSAYEHQAWWSNSRSHVQAVSWMDAGWRVVHVSFVTQRVIFSR